MLHWLRKILRLHSPASTGERGEQLAATWLAREKGFVVLTRNWRSPRDRREEIDLVCQDGETLVFVEVKARTDTALVPGFFAVDARKKRVLRRAIRAYLAQFRAKPRTFRFDIVEVSSPSKEASGRPEENTSQPCTIAANGCSIRHFENVPLFSKHFRV